MRPRGWGFIVLVVGLFGVGLLLGAGLRVNLEHPFQAPRPATVPRPWEDASTSRLPEATAPAPVSADAADPAAVPAKAPNDHVPRPLASYPQGPIRRALEGVLTRVKAQAQACRADEKPTPPPFAVPPVLAFEVEAVGGMATITQTTLLSGGAPAETLKSCLARKLAPLLIDFPTEDGTYAFTEPLDLSPAVPRH